MQQLIDEINQSLGVLAHAAPRQTQRLLKDLGLDVPLVILGQGTYRIELGSDGVWRNGATGEPPENGRGSRSSSFASAPNLRPCQSCGEMMGVHPPYLPVGRMHNGTPIPICQPCKDAQDTVQLRRVMRAARLGL